MLKSFRYLFLPVSLVYGAIIWVRNFFYDKNIFKSSSFNFPIICVGNLAIGGTGKTPMVEYLIRLLQNDYKSATLSRGYKRKTEGFAIAAENTTALEIGDEPMQFHVKFPEITVAVGEERLVAIPQLLHQRPGTEVIILDDAFQHRAVRAGLNLLLTEHKNLYTRDFMLPAGDLRDIRRSHKRAQVIIITKCPSGIKNEEKKDIIKELNPALGQSIYFTTITYGTPYHIFTKEEVQIKATMSALLLCGIANPRPLKEYLTAKVKTYDMIRFADHHIFNSDDLKEIQEQFEKIKAKQKIILTTEKDAVRLYKFEKELKTFPIYALPIEHSFLFNEAENFNSTILEFVKSFKSNDSL